MRFTRRLLMPATVLAAATDFILLACSPGWTFHLGKVRWPLKTNVPDKAALDNPRSVDLADLSNTEK